VGSHLRHHNGQITGINADRPQRGSSDGDGSLDSFSHVIGVDKQGRIRPHGGDLSAECFFFAVVHEGEGVRCRAPGGNVVDLAGLKITGGGKSGEVSSSGRSDCGMFMGSPGPHFDEHSRSRRLHHPGGGAGNGAVVVEHAEDEGLQEDCFSEGALHLKNR